ncbi:O-antigen polysaccharide polymerase Wzy [Pedobacter sp. LMG 31464]|uniref:O-antigen polysaccharide polymerase Wzy n=1 Tax=Pedobacter planticolens TaxID=2679964 RepID=A0A923E0N7_9SPHI|nr:O-antigen polymerase [Pedobacter planticolens]MBB2145923.1 O-antigen polysaccharide polymerase Wzy [Pedobacter planticolens]
MLKFKIGFVLPILIVACCLLGFAYMFFVDFFLIFFPVIIISLMSIPLLIRKKWDVFSIWSWVLYSSILGVLLRSFYIYFDLPNPQSIDTVFLLGKSKSFLFPAMVLIFVGIACMVGGYLSTKKRFKLKSKIFVHDKWNPKAFFTTSILLLVISIVGLILFIKAQGGLFSIASISSNYRGVSETLAEASPHAYLRLLVSFSGINLFLLTTWLIKYNNNKVMAYILWVISFLTFVFFNFYVSQRGAIVFCMVQLIALSYYLQNFKLPKVKLLIGLVVALVIFQIMTNLRGVTDVATQEVKVDFVKALEPAILTTNMIDVSKTAHIVDAIPTKLNYEYGSTLITVFFAWIPRELWPNKPVTNVDNTIGMKVFGSTTYGSGGVPPGIIAELYWNFWIPGVLLGCFLIGFLLKLINQTILSNIANSNIVIIYVVNFMFIGLSFVGSSFGSLLIGVLLTLIPTIVILNFITERR